MAAMCTIPTTMSYYLTPERGGTNTYKLGTAGYNNHKRDVVPIEAFDIRGVESDGWTLDIAGFQLVPNNTATEKEFKDDATIKGSYYPECAEVIKKVTGASHVIPFSHQVRYQSREEAEKANEGKQPHELVKTMSVSNGAHVDQDDDGAQAMLDQNLDKDEAARLTKTRWGIINLWRAIEPVKRDPIAVCDARSVGPEDLQSVTMVLPPRGGISKAAEITQGRSFGAYSCVANPLHKWYYFSGMTPDECLLIKCFDSKRDGRARACPHSAIITPTDSGPARRSLEVRNLVFWEDQTLE